MIDVEILSVISIYLNGCNFRRKYIFANGEIYGGEWKYGNMEIWKYGNRQNYFFKILDNTFYKKVLSGI